MEGEEDSAYGGVEDEGEGAGEEAAVEVEGEGEGEGVKAAVEVEREEDNGMAAVEMEPLAAASDAAGAEAGVANSPAAPEEVCEGVYVLFWGAGE